MWERHKEDKRLQELVMMFPLRQVRVAASLSDFVKLLFSTGVQSMIQQTYDSNQKATSSQP